MAAHNRGGDKNKGPVGRLKMEQYTFIFHIKNEQKNSGSGTHTIHLPMERSGGSSPLNYRLRAGANNSCKYSEEGHYIT